MTAADWNAHMRGATDARSGMAPRETGADVLYTIQYADGVETISMMEVNR